MFVGVAVGVLVGVAVGVEVGVGVSVGVAVGVAVGVSVGVAVGVSVGVFVGVAVGVFVGVFVGVKAMLAGGCAGLRVGVAVGVFVKPIEAGGWAGDGVHVGGGVASGSWQIDHATKLTSPVRSSFEPTLVACSRLTVCGGAPFSNRRPTAIPAPVSFVPLR